MYCDYGDVLEDMLRDRLVCGINDERVQRTLLSKDSTLTFKDALETAVALESARKNAEEIRSTSSSSHGTPFNSSAVHHVKSIPTQRERIPTQHKRFSRPCFRCAGKHHSDDCRFKAATCYKCSKQGHLASVCGRPGQGGGKPPFRGRPVQTNSRNVSFSQHTRPTFKHNSPTDRAHYFECEEEDISGSMYNLFNMSHNHTTPTHPPIYIDVSLNGAEHTMELDTGSARTIISENTYRNLWNKPPKLLTSEVCLNTYTNELVKAVGELDVVVQHNGQDKVLPLLVLPGNGVSLLGRNWLGELRLDWLRVLQFHQSSGVQSVLAKYPELFRSELGTLQGNMASLKIDPSVQPRFFKARPVPYALKPKTDLELDRLLADGIIEPVQHSQWAAPIVPVVKADGSIRICGDYKLTVNTASKVDSYPIPNPEDLFATLAGGKYFSTLDLSHAYLQILMDDASKPYLTVNTHRGLFTYNRLPLAFPHLPVYFNVLLTLSWVDALV